MPILAGRKLFLNSAQSKILIVTETPPGTPNGFGITLKNLFNNIEADVLYTDKHFRDEIKPNKYIFAHCPNHKTKKILPLFLIGLIPEWRGKYSPLWLFFFLGKKYDLIYSFFYSLENLKFASWIALKKKSKHIVHIADHCSSFFSSLEFERIMKTAHRRVCIGHNMRETYEERFNLPFRVFHNFADSQQLPLKKEPSVKFSSPKPFKLLFIGSIFEHLHKGTIQDICLAVKEMKSKGTLISFNIYGQIEPKDYLKNYIDDDSVFYHGIIEPDQRFPVMEKHHAYIVPSTFNQELALNYSLSIPTKLPELLGSGRPTIIFGPKMMESHRFCLKIDSGVLADKPGVENLKIVLQDIVENYHFRLAKAKSDAERTKDIIFGTKYRNDFVNLLQI